LSSSVQDAGVEAQKQQANKMVKADPKRNYYADLELPSTADAEDVKKQFRLLGILES
jgi:hypothetical protein